MQIEALNISKGFGIPGSPAWRTVLQELSLTVDQGESVAITGPSGSGKTTLLNLLSALDRPDSGLIRIGGTDITVLNVRELDDLRNRRIGLVFQQHHLLPQCTLLENVMIPALARSNRVPAAIRDRAGELVRRLGLWEARNRKPANLSGGECQRTALARALINDPDILLADEPTGALDHAHALNLVDLLVDINRTDGKTILMVTHSAEMAGRMGRRLELRDGRLHHEI